MRQLAHPTTMRTCSKRSCSQSTVRRRREAVLAYAQRLAGHYGSGVLVVCISVPPPASADRPAGGQQLRSDGVPARLAVVADGRERRL